MNFFLFFISTTFLVTTRCFPQAPAIEWSKTYGGTEYDNCSIIQQTADGGYIIGGYLYSFSGDVTFNFGLGLDIWIAKLDASGAIQWQKTYGGYSFDYLYRIKQTAEGGYICMGSTYSINGNVSGNHGQSDIWLFKISNAGALEWQKCFGGTDLEYGHDLQILNDGNYLISAYVRSNNGDVTFNHGSSDFWLIKTDVSGNLLWQKVFGGSASENCYSVEQTIDNGFILTGPTSSVDGDITFNHGGNDYWVIKLDDSANIVWQKCYGGSGDDVPFSVRQTCDNGYIVTGKSKSNNGDITDHHGLAGIDDIWVIKLDDVGEITWVKSYGGSLEEYNPTLEIIGSNYIITGSTKSNDGDVSLNMGNYDYWAFQINSIGELLWEKSVGGSNEDESNSIVKTIDGSVILAGETKSTDYDVFGNHGSSDYWVVKFDPFDVIELVESCNSIDDNCNGIIDDGVVESISISAGGATTFCQGNSVLLSATYSGTSIQWQKNGSNIAAATASTYSVNKTGNYTAVTTSPCGSTESSSINITVNKNPKASISAGGATTFCTGGSVTLTEMPSGGCIYQWYKGASLIAGATSTNYIATTAGNYKCRVTKIATGCSKNSNTISVTVPCKEGEWAAVNGELEFKISPNPNNGTFSITFGSLRETENTKLEIYNSLGQLIYSQQINTTQNNLIKTISLNNISPGIYFIHISDGVNSSQEKLIIQ